MSPLYHLHLLDDTDKTIFIKESSDLSWLRVQGEKWEKLRKGNYYNILIKGEQPLVDRQLKLFEN